MGVSPVAFWSWQVQAVRNAAAADAQKELAKQRTRLRRLEEQAESASESLRNLTGTVGDAARDAAAANEAVNGTGTGVISRLLRQVEIHPVARTIYGWAVEVRSVWWAKSIT
jgi:hypothetical protein